MCIFIVTIIFGIIIMLMSCWIGEGEIYDCEMQLAALHNERVQHGKTVAVSGWVYTEPVMYVR